MKHMRTIHKPGQRETDAPCSGELNGELLREQLLNDDDRELQTDNYFRPEC